MLMKAMITDLIDSNGSDFAGQAKEDMKNFLPDKYKLRVYKQVKKIEFQKKKTINKEPGNRK